MEIFKFNIVQLPEDERQQAFKEAVNQCPDCNEQMHFQTEVDYLIQEIEETCYCPSCNMHVRSEKFSLQ